MSKIMPWVLVAVATFAPRVATGAQEHRLPASGWRSAERVQWTWSPVAKHHTAMVRVRQGDAWGSGVYVELGGVRGVLTAAHVIEEGRSCQVVWIDGRRTASRAVTIDPYKQDIGFVFLAAERPDVRPLPISDRNAAPGEFAEVCGYGAATPKLRHYFVKVQPRQWSDDTARPGPIHGDSGGAILTRDSAGRIAVASVVSAGAFPRLIAGEKAYGELLYARPEHVRAFCARVYQTQCGPGGCAPPYRQPYQQPGRQQPPSELFPPGRNIQVGPFGQGPPQQPAWPPWRQPADPGDPVEPQDLRGKLHQRIDRIAEKVDKLHALWVWVQRLGTFAGLIGGGVGLGFLPKLFGRRNAAPPQPVATQPAATGPPPPQPMAPAYPQRGGGLG